MDSLTQGLQDELNAFMASRPYKLSLEVLKPNNTFEAKCFWYETILTSVIKISETRTGVEFFRTLCHELAHAEIFYEYGVHPTIKGHCSQWKMKFREIVLGFLGKGYFSKEIEQALVVSMRNPLHHSGQHPLLKKALNPGKHLVAEIACGGKFMCNGVTYTKLSQRYCTAKLIDEEGNNFQIHKNVLVQAVF